MQLRRILAALSTLAIAGTSAFVGPAATPAAADTFPMSPSDPTYAASWINSAARDGISSQDIDVSLSAPTQAIASLGSTISLQVTLHNTSQATIGGLQFRVAASTSLVDTATSRLRLADGETTFGRLLTAGNISASDGRLGPDDSITLTLRVGVGTSVADDPDPATVETIAAPFPTAAVGTYGILFSVQGAVVDGTSTTADAHTTGGGSSRFLLPVDTAGAANASSTSANGASSAGGTAGTGTTDGTTPRTPLSFVWPLTATVNTVPGETGDAPNPSRLILTNDSLATELSAGGRLYSLLHTYADATTATPALRTASCVAIDPDLLSTVYRMTSGYSIGSSRPSAASAPTRLRDSWTITQDNNLTEGTGADAARQWLDDLTTVAQQGCVVALPASNTDLDALARTRDPWLAITALALGNATIARILNTVPLTNVVIPGSGYLTTASLPLLANAFTDATLPGAIISTDSQAGSASTTSASGGSDGSSADSAESAGATSPSSGDANASAGAGTADGDSAAAEGGASASQGAADGSSQGASSSGSGSSSGNGTSSSATTYADIVESLSSMSLEEIFEAAAKVHVTAMQAASEAGSAASSASSTSAAGSGSSSSDSNSQSNAGAGSNSADSNSASNTANPGVGSSTSDNAGSSAASGSSTATGSSSSAAGGSSSATGNVLSPVDWPSATGRVTALVAESALSTSNGAVATSENADLSNAAAAWNSRRVDLGSNVTGVGFNADLAATLAATGTTPEVAAYAAPITRYNEALDSSAARMQDAIAVMWQAATTGNLLLVMPPAQWTATNDEATSFLNAIASLLTTHASATPLTAVVGAVTRTVAADASASSTSQSSTAAQSSDTDGSASASEGSDGSGSDGASSENSAQDTSAGSSDSSSSEATGANSAASGSSGSNGSNGSSGTGSSSGSATTTRTVASASQDKPAVTATIENPYTDTGVISDVAVNKAAQQAATVTRLTLTMRNDARIALHRAQFTEPLRADILRALTANARRSRQAFDQLTTSSDTILSGNSATLHDLATAVTLIPPGNVFTRMSSSSPILIAARNGLPLPVSAYVEWTTPDGSSEVDTNASIIPARGSLTLQLNDAVPDQSGQLTLSLWLVSADKQVVSEPVTLTIRSAPGMSWEGIAIVVGVLLVIAATGIIARERRRNM
ncbi:MAG: hypothetical protein Q4G37_02075 [Bifidobacterium sp.]|nr:hypothetical protein [Bifidobacterium sp.]